MKMNNLLNQIKQLDFSNFTGHFSKEKFDSFLRSFGPKLRFIKPLLELYFCMKDPKTPVWFKAMIAGVLGYVIFPFDLVPDMLPFAGYTDDALAVVFMVGQAGNMITDEHRMKAAEVLNRLSKGSAPGL